MTKELIPCLYCQTENESQQLNCTNCGMPLAKKHPNNKTDKLNFFVKAFILITIFCIAMVIYLPR